jgi:hypothetical protein
MAIAAGHFRHCSVCWAICGDFCRCCWRFHWLYAKQHFLVMVVEANAVVVVVAGRHLWTGNDHPIWNCKNKTV